MDKKGGGSHAKKCGGRLDTGGAALRRRVFDGTCAPGGHRGDAGDGGSAGAPGRGSDPRHSGRRRGADHDPRRLPHRRGAGRDARLLRAGGTQGAGGGGAQLRLLPAVQGAQGRPPGRGLLHRPHLLQCLSLGGVGKGEMGRRLPPVEHPRGAGGLRHGWAGGTLRRRTHSGGVPLLLVRENSVRRRRMERRSALPRQR